jgi:coenzyme F420-reducing hydrogenase delta subunit
MYWLSSAESEKFVKSIEDARDKIAQAGPNPINAVAGNERELESSPPL